MNIESFRKHLLMGATGMATALLLVACGGGDDGATKEAPPPPAEVVNGGNENGGNGGTNGGGTNGGTGGNGGEGAGACRFVFNLVADNSPSGAATDQKVLTISTPCASDGDPQPEDVGAQFTTNNGAIEAGGVECIPEFLGEYEQFYNVENDDCD